MMKYFLSALFIAFTLTACTNEPSNNNATVNIDNPAPPEIAYSIVRVYPHDTSTYTQGLEWKNNSLFESGGNYNHSRILNYDLSGKVLKSTKVPDKYFAEGITLLNNKIYMLTWKENKVFVYDAATLQKTGEFNWPYEGWGITNNGKQLIIGTGSSILYFVDPETFKILNQVNVTNNYGPLSMINELEYANNHIYANIYETDYIVKIDPETGSVVGQLNLAGLLQKSGMNYNPQSYTPATGNVLNGIAFDSSKNTFYITGKLWPALFEIKLNN